VNDPQVLLVVEIVTLVRGEDDTVETIGYGWGVQKLFKQGAGSDSSNVVPASAKRCVLDSIENNVYDWIIFQIKNYSYLLATLICT